MVAAAEWEVSAARAAAHAEAVGAVRAAAIKHMDKAGWKRVGRRCWPWVGVTRSVARFQVHARRGWDGSWGLLDDPAGFVVSDRWATYSGWRSETAGGVGPT
jgi:hypothetical protein